MRKVCSLTAIVLLAGATVAAAQDAGKGRERGGHSGPAASPRSGGPGPSNVPSPRASQPPSPRPAMRAPERPPAARQVERPRTIDRPRAVERSRAPEPRVREERRAAGQRALEQRRAGEQQRNRAAEQRASERRAPEQRRDAERRRAEEQRASEERAAQPRKAGERPAQAQPPGAGQPGTSQRALAKHQQLRQERAKLSDDQRARVRRSFTVNRERTARVHFTRHIGSKVPRRARLYAVPAAVLAIFPYYRDYRYLVDDDVICIVDPETYEIVDVLDEEFYAPGARPQIAELTLTEREKRLVLDSIPPDFPRIELRLRLALGAEIPRNVTLNEFAPLVLDQIPKLRNYRFVLTPDELVIVAPWDRGIALVVEH